MTDKKYTLGIDIGSTTVKIAILDEENQLLFADYERHFANIQETLAHLLGEAHEKLGELTLQPVITGSGGLALANHLGIPFTQEVIAVSTSLKALAPQTDVAIELGGEDAKIIYFEGGNVEQRMNGVCAGGTGSFIDQMASLLQTDAAGLNELAKGHKVIYPIASRCGVFAKTDIQPLINEGAKKEDLAASIFQAVVNQTIAGLACGKPIRGHVAFLGGPLHFLSELRQRFIETLKLTEETTIIPENSHLFAAYGTAVSNTGEAELDFDTLLHKLENGVELTAEVSRMEPLFRDEADYAAFKERHDRDKVRRVPLSNYHGDAFLGVDAGSTTTKVALVSKDGDLLYSFYAGNEGNPLNVVMKSLNEMYDMMPEDVVIRNSCVTGYGEGLIKEALMIDLGYIETVAHYKAAQFFKPDVDFILDIGGQDMKCIRIKDNVIDSVLLNEACSSGCGSFIETFAKSMGYTAEEFARLGLFSQYPVDLGSRCTVFMNSSVKQAQKDGAGVEDISAGLSMSVVKNVLYKVIRARNADELGEHIVVQGGTFLNDAVLRSFEKEIGHDVIRPDIAGLMGAYGAAIYAKGICPKEQTRSSMLGAQQLENFQHESKPVVCQGCTNHCNLNIFAGGERDISGNRCEKPLGLGKERQLPDLYRFKLEQIRTLSEDCAKRAAAHTGKRGVIGLPLGLNMYENLFFWEAFFRNLDFDIVVSDLSSRALYAKGQYSVPSDTACYPAKLMHGHIENLLDKGVTTIFYPCMSYNFDESKGDNHFNCPVVAYYPELLASNVEKLKQVRYLYPYLDLAERKTFPKKIWQALKEYYPDLTLREVKRASDCAYESYHRQREQVKEEGRKALEFARQKGLKTIILCGRPYHVDPEINHGINQLITSLGLVVVTEDCVADLVQPVRPDVLNQWTYHSRLYNAAEYVVEHRDCELVQLVSFGCGIDAITTDEVSAILARGQRLYTQLKIDEINNLGAVRIRIRSLIGAVRERDANTQQ